MEFETTDVFQRKTNSKKRKNSSFSYDLDSNFIDFNNYSKFSIVTTFNLNLYQNQETSVLLTKPSKTALDEFITANSNFTCNYYKITESEIKLLNSYTEHTGRINDMSFFDDNQSPFEKCFITASSDSSLKIWDIRSKDSIQTLKSNSKQEVWSLATSKDHLVSGCGRELHHRDLKKVNSVKVKKNAHSNDITCINIREDQFNNKTVLLTGSEDNIINLFDITDKDNFVKLVPELIYNVNTPVQSCNFLDENYRFIDLISTQNSYHIFNEYCSELFSFNALNDLFKTEYIIKSQYLPQRNLIEVYCGNYSGDIVVLNVLLEQKPCITYDSIISTGVNQFISSLIRINDKISLCSSDMGFIYIIEEKDKYFENFSLLEAELKPNKIDYRSIRKNPIEFNPY